MTFTLTPSRRAGLLLSLAAMLIPPAAAQAQQTKERAVRKPVETRTVRPAERPSGMKPCPEYGAGFYKLEGSDTCVRIGGGIGIDVGAASTWR
jgi:hypothetical protein